MCGKSIKHFSRSLGVGSLTGFKRSTTKESLAAFVLVKAGIIEIEDVEVKRDPTHRGFNHPEHRYWLMFEERYADLQKLLPYPVPQPPALSAPSLLDIYPLEPVLPYYECTNWFVYSRARKGGIYRHILKIEPEKAGHFNKVFLKNASSGVEDYIGFVGMDIAKGYLIFNLVTQHSRQKHLHVKVKCSLGTYPKVAVGQMNCISSFSNQIISDVVVFERSPKDVDIERAARFLPLDSPEYLELPLCLRRYFHQMGKCRLHAPKTDIISLHQLDEWVNDQLEKKEPSKTDPILLQLCDDYAVFYETPESNIEQRFISIYKDVNVEEVSAAAAPDYRAEFRHAEVYRYEETVTLFQTEIVGSQTRTCNLSFKIPLVAKAQASWYFEGLVMGFWQGLGGSASRALIVNKKIPEFEAKTKQLVHDFFWTAFQVLES